MARASGVNYDVRRAEPYSVYDRFDFQVPVTFNGDTYDRYLVRVREIRQSVRILQQALRDIPEGEYTAKVPRALRPPAGEAYTRIEAPKGELGFYLVSDGGPNPYRWHVRAPTFINLSLPEGDHRRLEDRRCGGDPGQRGHHPGGGGQIGWITGSVVADHPPGLGLHLQLLPQGGRPGCAAIMRGWGWDGWVVDLVMMVDQRRPHPGLYPAGDALHHPDGAQDHRPHAGPLRPQPRRHPQPAGHRLWREARQQDAGQQVPAQGCASSASSSPLPTRSSS